MSSPNPTPLTVVERVQDFVIQHKKAILITTAAAAIAAGGVAYYASTSSRPRGSGGDVGRAEKKEKKRSNKNGKKKKGGDKDGPILEERKPKVESTAQGMCIILLEYKETKIFCRSFRSYKRGKMSN
jgi:import receptor subunit TOM70